MWQVPHIYPKDNKRCVIVPVLQAGKPTSQKAEWFALGTSTGAQSQEVPPGLCDGRAHAWHHRPPRPLLTDGSNLPGGHGGMESGAETGIGSLAFLAEVWKMSSHCWPRVHLLLSTTFPNGAAYTQLRALRGGGGKGQPTPSPINLGGMDSLLELSQEAAFPATGQESKRTPPQRGDRGNAPLLPA